jgi:hypothetical protein
VGYQKLGFPTREGPKRNSPKTQKEEKQKGMTIAATPYVFNMKVRQTAGTD